MTLRWLESLGIQDSLDLKVLVSLIKGNEKSSFKVRTSYLSNHYTRVNIKIWECNWSIVEKSKIRQYCLCVVVRSLWQLINLRLLGSLPWSVKHELTYLNVRDDCSRLGCYVSPSVSLWCTAGTCSLLGNTRILLRSVNLAR